MATPSNTCLCIRLFGGFALEFSGEAVRTVDKSRMQSLLGYLVLHAGVPQLRAHLAFVFWPDSEEKQALTNLRNLLHHLRLALPQSDVYLQIDSHSITWNAEACYSLDIEEFSACINRANAVRANGETARVIELLEKAVALYVGDLLPSCYNEWIEPERERLRLEVQNALLRLVEVLKSAGRASDGIRYAKRMIQQDPLSESSHSALIELHAMTGDRAAAVAAYQSCARILNTELGIEPGETLRALHQTLLARGAISGPSISENPNEDSSVSLNEAPVISTAEPTYPRHTRATLILAGIVALFLAILFVWRIGWNDREASPFVPKSLAVLPFENRSSLAEDQYFTDGIHDDLITRISSIGEIKTISRTSVMAFRGTRQNLKYIGRELGASTILEGGVQRSGNQIRINVQLIDAASDHHLWAKSYTRELTASNIFAIQSAIVSDVARSLHAALSSAQNQRIDSPPTENLEALEAYFEGRMLAAQLNGADLDEAIDRFEYAIDLDPDFAAAYAELAQALLGQIFYLGLSSERQIAQALPLIDRALALDNELGVAYTALGTIKRYSNDWQGAREAYARAVAYSPNDAPTYYLYGNLVEWKFRDPALALKLKARAVELDPMTFGSRLILNTSLSALGRFDEAREILGTVVEEQPDNAYAYYDLGRFVANVDYRMDQAIVLLLKGFEFDPQNPNFAREIALCYEYIGNDSEAANWMQRAADLAPEGPSAATYRAQALAYLGKTDEGLRIFDQIPPGSDYYGWSLYYLSVADLRAGRYERARDRILKAYPSMGNAPGPRADKTNFWFASLLAHAYFQLDQRERGDRLAQDIFALFEQMPRMGVGQGGYGFEDVTMLAASGDVERALAKLREAIALGYFPNTLNDRPELEVLQAEPTYQAMLDEIEAALQQQRFNLEAHFQQ